MKIRIAGRSTTRFLTPHGGASRSLTGTEVALSGNTMPMISGGYVLVADDQPLIRWAIGTTIRSLGFEPVFAASQSEARKLANQTAFAMAVIADPMEERDSGDLLIELRRRGTTRVIVLTASGAAVLPPDLPGAIAVEKPFSLESVISAVGTLTSQPG